MVIVEVSGGIGNQLFQFAFGQEITRRLNVIVKYDLSFFSIVSQHQGFLLDKFFKFNEGHIATNSDIRKCFGLFSFFTPRRIYLNNRFKTFFSDALVKQSFSISPNTYLDNLSDQRYYSGNWQSEFFFNSSSAILAESLLSFCDFKTDDLLIRDKMLRNNSVVIHVRRGDYVSSKSNFEAYHVCDINYYINAINMICNNNNDLKFFIFSDDIEWCQCNLKLDNDVTFVSHNVGTTRSYIDLFLMSFAKHHIIANSSFSWWGRWLAEARGCGDGFCVAPKRWGNTDDAPVNVPRNSWTKI
jgi:hypothetical protein